MKTQKQTFEQLRVRAINGSYFDTINIRDRLINTFVHGGGVRVLRDAVKEMESMYFIAMELHGDNLGSPERITLKALANILNQLNGEPTK